MNKDLKFLSTSILDDHTDKKYFYNWVEKDQAEVFPTENFKTKLKLRNRNYHSDISSAIVDVFEVKVVRTVTIIKQLNLETTK
jgi:hypothetical protein